MAEKRMFTKKIVDSDAFLDMPLSTQCLYFHLNMRADDDGFINNPKKIQRMIGASEDDLKLLIAKRFVLVFENGVIVIKHWRMHNTLRKDRYNPTQYQEQYHELMLKDNGSYTEKIIEIPSETHAKLTGNHMATDWQPDGNQMATQYSIDKNSIDKNSIDKNSINNISDSEESQNDKPVKKRKQFKPPSVEEVNDYCIERNNNVNAEAFVDFYESKGWMVGKNKMKDWKAAVRNWERSENKKTSYTSKEDAIKTRVSVVDSW